MTESSELVKPFLAQAKRKSSSNRVPSQTDPWTYAPIRKDHRHAANLLAFRYKVNHLFNRLIFT